MMRKKIYTIIFFFFIVSSEIVHGKDSSKNNKHKASKSHTKDKLHVERIKRSLDDEDDKPFWANRGKKQVIGALDYHIKNDYQDKVPKVLNDKGLDVEPFWGTRGRRDSASTENYVDEEYPDYVSYDHSNCRNCNGNVQRSNKDKSFRLVEDNEKPFWGNRGRRDSNEVQDSSNPFWGNRGRRQDDDPFWGTRGRRDEPFWGARGRREDEPFWGNRGRRQDADPFWGNRGRRQESEPFWGNRGRRDDEPFWGNRGRKKEDDAFWGGRGRRKEDLKEYILSAINDVENDINHLSRLKKKDLSFWANRGRDSKLHAMFNEARARSVPLQLPRNFNVRNSDPGTVTDSRIYAERPSYILVERSSRSSGEDDPFFITRGKKYNINEKLFKAARDRRGAIEEIVKSVRNDPYFIARGKKDGVNFNSTDGDLMKVKELVCAAVDLIHPKVTDKGSDKEKRGFDSDRERRTILKKIAAQLQNDPYFVSRGKKNDNDEYLREFVNKITEKC